MTVEEFLQSLDEPRRTQAGELDGIIRAEAPDLAVELRGESIYYGPYHYRYPTGREGESARVVLAPRKAGISLYICEGLSEPIAGANTGVGCVRIKDLRKVDLEALRREIRRVVATEPSMLKREGQ